LRASTIFALSIFSLPILAENEPSKPAVNTSWQPYVGGSLGYGRMSTKNNWSENVSGTLTTGKNNFNSKGSLGLLHVGVQKSITPTMKFGGELYGFFESHKASVDTPSSRTESLKKESGGGIKLKAGYLFDTHSSFYVHAGVEKAGFKYVVDLGAGTTTVCKKYLWGAPFGVGIEASLSHLWTARLEYTHTVYQKWDTGMKSVGTDSSRAKISPSQDSILLGLSYTF
jgi:opacity protein-like surface antigen